MKHLRSEGNWIKFKELDFPTVCLEPSQVYNGLDEDGVVTYVGVFRVQLGERTEERAAAGNVHITDGPLKG